MYATPQVSGVLPGSLQPSLRMKTSATGRKEQTNGIHDWKERANEWHPRLEGKSKRMASTTGRKEQTNGPQSRELSQGGRVGGGCGIHFGRPLKGDPRLSHWGSLFFVVVVVVVVFVFVFVFFVLFCFFFCFFFLGGGGWLP